MVKNIFPDYLLLRVLSASYKIKGCCDADGKEESIWDRFCYIQRWICINENGYIACGNYSKFEEDIRLMTKSGISVYSFSTSWPRIFPSGTSEINYKGIALYNKATELSIMNGILSAVTLYRWDLSQKFQDIDGLAYSDIMGYFERFALLMFNELGDMVPFWIILIEPGVSDFMGNSDVSHNLLLYHGKAVSTFGENGINWKSGIASSMEATQPFYERNEDIDATGSYDGFVIKWSTELILIVLYSYDVYNWCLSKIISMPEIKKDEIGWEIYPERLYDILINLSNKYKVERMITENEAAYNYILDAKSELEDDLRIEYLYYHIIQAYKAIKERVALIAYFGCLLRILSGHIVFRKISLGYIDHKTPKRIHEKVLCGKEILF